MGLPKKKRAQTELTEPFFNSKWSFWDEHDFRERVGELLCRSWSWWKGRSIVNSQPITRMRDGRILI